MDISNLKHDDFRFVKNVKSLISSASHFYFYLFYGSNTPFIGHQQFVNYNMMHTYTLLKLIDFICTLLDYLNSLISHYLITGINRYHMNTT